MNTPTPTPRTDAAWASSFEPCEYRAAHTARTMRECSQQLETELAALTTERDQLRAALALGQINCDAEYDDLRAERDAAIARAERAEAELATEREKVTMLLSDAYALTKNWHDRAEKAEREVGRLRAGIAACLDTNGHLADGEDCTLIGLKRCLRDPAATRESNGGAA